MENVLIHLSKEQIEKYVEIYKRINPEDLVYRKQNVNRYRTVMSFAFNILTEVVNIDEMCKMFNEFNNKVI